MGVSGVGGGLEKRHNDVSRSKYRFVTLPLHNHRERSLQSKLYYFFITLNGNRNRDMVQLFLIQQCGNSKTLERLVQTTKFRSPIRDCINNNQIRLSGVVCS